MDKEGDAIMINVKEKTWTGSNETATDKYVQRVPGCDWGRNSWLGSTHHVCIRKRKPWDILASAWAWRRYAKNTTCSSSDRPQFVRDWGLVHTTWM